MPVQPKFRPDITTEFSRVLRDRVSEHFRKSNTPTHANGAMVLKTILLISTWIGTYSFLVFGDLPLWLSFPVWAFLGALIALVCVNVGHDAIHGAYTKKKWLRKLLSHSFNLNGASAYMWKISHNHAHHNYTNIHGHDDDVSPGDFLRVSPGTRLRWFHRFQHVYAFLFYGLATLSWVFAKDYVQFFQNKINNYDQSKHPISEYFLLFFYKILNYALYLAVPLVFMPYDWGYILLGYGLMHLVSGFYLAIIFMLAHAVEEVHFPEPDGQGVLKEDWIVHQLRTTANFASQSWWASFLTGGLNHQVEHHLFANICSIHYRPIAKIVKETTAEFGLPYYDLPSFGAAVRSHLRFLRAIGKTANYVPKTAELRPAYA